MQPIEDRITVDAAIATIRIDLALGFDHPPV